MQRFDLLEGERLGGSGFTFGFVAVKALKQLMVGVANYLGLLVDKTLSETQQ